MEARDGADFIGVDVVFRVFRSLYSESEHSGAADQAEVGVHLLSSKAGVCAVARVESGGPSGVQSLYEVQLERERGRK